MFLEDWSLCRALSNSSNGVAGISAGAIVAYRSYLDLNLAAAILGVILVFAVALSLLTATKDRRRDPFVFAVSPVPDR